MLLNADLGSRTLVHADTLDWVESPARGVTRRMLYREGEEKARATSIVRYAPGSRFAQHTHTGGEEFFVLDGTFQDESGDYPPGSYVRNPPGSAHEPRTEMGCTIFVRLCQFNATDHERVVRLPGEGHACTPRQGVESVRVLFENADERVSVESWEEDAGVEVPNANGIELLVIAGEFSDGAETLDRWTWLRLPAGKTFTAYTGPNGARVWIKAAPLRHDDVCGIEGEMDRT